MAGLAVTPLADRVHVVAAGVDCYGFANEARVTAVAGAEDALAAARAASAPLRTALADASCSSFALRAELPLEVWEPVVAIVVGGGGEGNDPLDELTELAAGAGGVALLTDASVPGARWRLTRAGNAWRLDPLGLIITPCGLAADELADLGALLADASTPPRAAPPTALTRSANGEVRSIGDAAPSWDFLVRVLGPVVVEDRAGAVVPFERAKALELVVWLAQHRVHPTRTGARTALWESAVRDATFANVVSDARRALSRHRPPEGAEWIGRTYTDHLPLHDRVSTDAEVLETAYEQARRRPRGDAEAVAALRQGLELVRDLPYTGTSYLWPDAEALPSHLTLLVVHSACELARRYLDGGDTEGVFWATSQGMKVLPGHDELVCLRMRAHGHDGNLAGVKQEFAAYERLVTSDPWGDAEPSHKVVETRGELLRGGQR